MVNGRVDKLAQKDFIKNISGEGKKLRTYRLFKTEPGLEDYTKLSRQDRRLIVELRCGVLPLRIETGRWQRRLLFFEFDLNFMTLCHQDEGGEGVEWHSISS